MRLTKLATALVAMAAFAPLSASAGPSITNVEQINQTVEAVYSNNFAQSASVSGAANVGIAAGDVVDTGAGITNDAVYTLTPNLTNLTNSISIVGGTVTPITKPTTVTAQMADNTGTGVLSLDTSALAGDAVSVSTTVFGVSSIKASQSIVQSMTTSAF